MTDSRGFDTYDDEINSGNRLVLVLFAVMVVFLASMVYVSALETKGGIYNNSFEYGTGSANTASWIGDKNYGWYLGSVSGTISVDYNSTYKSSGNQSLRITTTNGRGRITVISQTSTITSAKLWHLIPVKPSTKYKFCYDTKINTDTGTGLRSSIKIFTSSFVEITTTGTIIPVNSADFVTNCTTFTTHSNAHFVRILFYTGASSTENNTGEMFLDNIRLEEVDTVSLSTQQSGRPSLTITGVTDTNAIDQSQTTGNLNYYIGDSGGTDYNLAQSFIPTQKKFVSFDVNKQTTLGTPTGNLVFELRTNTGSSYSSTILASKTYTLSEWNALSNGINKVQLPAIVDANTTNVYWVTVRNSVTTESNNNAYVISANSMEDIWRNFITKQC